MAQCEADVINPKSPNFGKQCGRQAMTGAQHCAMHGGRDEVSFDAVKKRLDNPSPQCTATSSTSGERCRKLAIKGGTVCSRHGGQLPHVRDAARNRLLSLVSPALAELQRIIDKSTTSDTDRLKAIQLVLDRTGYHAKTELAAEIELKPWQALVNGTILRDVPDAADENVIDAEVVDDWRAPLDVARDEIEAAYRDHPRPLQPDNVIEFRSSNTPPKHLR